MTVNLEQIHAVNKALNKALEPFAPSTAAAACVRYIAEYVRTKQPDKQIEAVAGAVLIIAMMNDLDIEEVIHGMGPASLKILDITEVLIPKQ